MCERILLLHPEGKKGVRLSKDKYDKMRETLLAIVAESGEITFMDLLKKVEKSRLIEGESLYVVKNLRLDFLQEVLYAPGGTL